MANWLGQPEPKPANRDQPREEAHVQKLEERLDALERQQQEDRILRLRALQARPVTANADNADDPTSDVAEPIEPDAVPLSPDELTAKARRTYASRLVSEGTDVNWSSKREAEITVALHESDIAGIALSKVTCGKTLCELNLEQEAAFQPNDLFKVFTTIHPNGSFYSEKDVATGRLVVFVARSGELPAPTSQDG